MKSRIINSLSLNNFSFWILASLLLKGIYVIIFYSDINFGLLTIGGEKCGAIGYLAGDTPGYFDPIESLLKSGTYDPDFRMPGYGIPYLILRLFLSQHLALDALIIVQLILSALSYYCLGKSVYMLTNSKLAFYLSFFLYGLSMRSTYWDFMFLTESLTISFTIFATFFLIKFYKTRFKAHCLLAGIFITWAVFLRPVYAPLIPLFALSMGFVLYFEWSLGVKKVVQWMLLFSLPWLIADGLWMVKNYSKHKEVIPLTKGLYLPSDSYMANLSDFVIAYGGERSYWKPTAEIRWYLPDTKKFVPNQADEPPSYIYTSIFNRDSLLAIRRDLQLIEDSTTPHSIQKSLLATVKEKLKKYELSIKREKPFLFYIKARFIFLKRFLLHSGTDYLPPLKIWDMNVKQLFLKLFNTTTYLASVFLGGIACLYILWKRKVQWYLFMLISIYSTLIFPVLGHLEHRYFAPAYPFLMGCMVYLLILLINNAKKRFTAA